MKLKCIIIDDEPVARKLLSEYIEDVDFLELTGKAENPVKANSLVREIPVDLVFLDINMPKMSGLDYLRAAPNHPLTIITTAYAEYAIDGYELNVLDYLVKPFSFERFLMAANKARDLVGLKQISNPAGNNDNDHFFVKCDGKIEKIFYNDLIYVEAMLNYVILHTETRKMIVYLTIKGILEQLPPGRFIKIHKSFIVNINKIRSIYGNELQVGTSHIPISQNLYETVLKEIIKGNLIKR
jgi:DNA-binding LytR/AlgR family response regulator